MIKPYFMLNCILFLFKIIDSYNSFHNYIWFPLCSSWTKGYARFILCVRLAGQLSIQPFVNGLSGAYRKKTTNTITVSRGTEMYICFTHILIVDLIGQILAICWPNLVCRWNLHNFFQFLYRFDGGWWSKRWHFVLLFCHSLYVL